MVEECSSQLTGFDEGLEGIDGPEFNILYNDQGTEGNIIYIISGSTITLFNEYTGLAEGVIDRKASSVINAINDDACLVIGNVVRLSGGSKDGLEGINGGTGTLIWDEDEESGPVGFIEEDPNLLLPGMRAVDTLGANAYGIVVGGDFDGIYKDGTLNSNDLAKGIAVAFKGDGVRVCTQGRCLALADGNVTGSINVGDDLMTSAKGLVKALFGAPVIARALQATSQRNSIIAVDVQRIAGLESIWAFKKQLTVDASKVTGASPLLDFPLLVSITDTDLRDNARPDGFDIFFTASDGITRIPYQRESYDGTTGTLVAWVLTDLSDTVNNNLFMYYGNPNAIDQHNPNGLWDRFEDVFLFNETAFPWLNSSVGKDFSLFFVPPSPVSGQIDTASDSNTLTVFFGMPSTSPTTVTDWYVSAWIRYNTISATVDAFYDSWSSDVPIPLGVTSFQLTSGLAGDAISNEDLIVLLFDNGSAEPDILVGDMSDLSYHHIAARYSSTSTNVDVFFDGNFVSSTSFIPSTSFAFDAQECGEGSNDFSSGRIDQLQVAHNSNFSNGFIETSFNNQSDSGQGAGNFVVVGPQEPAN